MLSTMLEFAVILGLMTGLAILMGKWLTRVFTGRNHALAERATYRLLGIDPAETMGWARYGSALLLSNAAMMLLGYIVLRLQGFMPLNPLELSAQTPDLAFNTAASFITNTNWQAYSGETSLSNFSQMAVITFLMFVGATAGVVAAAGFIRGLSRSNSADIGNYWVDFTRMLYRVMLPLCFGMALVYVWQGMPQTLSSEALATTLEGAQQQLIVGAVASFESIKHIGTNGGGFFSMNAAHPFENPTPLTNMLHILSMLLIPSALTYTFGSMLMRRRQGWVFFGTFLVMFVGFLSIVYTAEQSGNPLLTRVGADQVLSATQSGGNMEGKELRFGIADTSLFVTTTTGATTGSVNAMHDSLTPMGGFVPLAQMMLNCVFGGDGVGFINLIQYALLTVFLVGMMIGRSPGIPRQEDRGTGDQAGHALGAGAPHLHSRFHRPGGTLARHPQQPQQPGAPWLQRGALCLHLGYGQQRFGVRRIECQYAVLQHHHRSCHVAWTFLHHVADACGRRLPGDEKEHPGRCRHHPDRHSAVHVPGGVRGVGGGRPDFPAGARARPAGRATAVADRPDLQVRGL